MRSLALLLFLALLGACAPPVEPGPPVAPALEISVHEESAPLTALGTEALALTPLWLRPDVAVSLRQLEANRADELAALIVDAADPRYIDEIAFGIAHLSPEILSDTRFHPVLLSLNAELIYARDADLDFVALTEFGTPGEDEDFWTATTYTWERGGVIVEETVDREIYYWQVVHPRLEDEHPWFVDAWAPCSAPGLQCPSTPEEGLFWREFLWDAAQDECPDGWCPVLREFVANDRVTDDEAVRLDIAWNGASGGEARGAVRELVRWMFSSNEEGQCWITFGAEGERSVQPNRIYGLGRGNCGEWADMTNSALRTILMPGLSVKPTSWDHTWNSFWTGERWAEMEPVNTCIDCSYRGSPATVGARGDTSMMMQTADYSEETFTMEVEVVDAEGAPVAGASVRAFAPWVIDGTTYWDTAGEQPTNADGLASFQLEVGHEFGLRVETPLVSWPTADNTLNRALSDTIPADAVERVTTTLEATLPPGLELTVDSPGGPRTVAVAFADQQGRALTASQRFQHHYATPVDAPTLELALVDAAGYEALQAGEAIDAVWAGGNSDDAFEVPEGGPWYLVLSNPHLSVAATGALDVSAGEGGVQTSFAILPGGRLTLLLEWS